MGGTLHGRTPSRGALVQRCASGALAQSWQFSPGSGPWLSPVLVLAQEGARARAGERLHGFPIEQVPSTCVFIPGAPQRQNTAITLPRVGWGL